MNKDMILGLVRHLLTFGGGFLVAKGWGDAETVQTVAAAVATIVGVLWSAYDKRPA